MDESSWNTSFICMLIECQQELNKEYSNACQNVKDKKESDVHKMLMKIPNAKMTRPYLVDDVLKCLCKIRRHVILILIIATTSRTTIGRCNMSPTIVLAKELWVSLTKKDN
jgi:hypothetical protein